MQQVRVVTLPRALILMRIDQEELDMSKEQTSSSRRAGLGSKYPNRPPPAPRLVVENADKLVKQVSEDSLSGLLEFFVCVCVCVWEDGINICRSLQRFPFLFNERL